MDAETMAALRPKLHRYAARMMGSAFDGEDVVQEALTRAAAAWDSGAAIDQLERWLLRVVHNVAIDALRKRRREALEALDEELAGGDAADTRVAVRAALATFLVLTPTQRGAVVLADVLGHSADESAKILEMSVAAFKSALHRGRARLRPLAEVPAQLDVDELARLADYAARFNAHDWDALRGLLAEDVKLDLVARTRLTGKGDVGIYFTRYSERAVWRLEPVRAEGRPALLARAADTGEPTFVVLLTWRGGRIASIRDFYYARWIMEGLVVAF